MNSVCDWTTSGGMGLGGGGVGVPQLSHSSLETTSWAALTQCYDCLSEEKTRLTRITITWFLISFGNERRHQDLLRLLGGNVEALLVICVGFCTPARASAWLLVKILLLSTPPFIHPLFALHGQK